MTTEKLTNRELFDELKNRGFFVFPEEIKENKIPNCIVVSVEKPEKDIYITWQVNWEDSRDGSNVHINSEE